MEERRAGPLAQLMWDLATLPSLRADFVKDPKPILASRGLDDSVLPAIHGDTGLLVAKLREEDAKLDATHGPRPSDNLSAMIMPPPSEPPMIMPPPPGPGAPMIMPPAPEPGEPPMIMPPPPEPGEPPMIMPPPPEPGAPMIMPPPPEPESQVEAALIYQTPSEP